MAYASVRTLIPLDNVARILSIDPLHFNGVVTKLRPVRNACDDVWSQYDWQMTGRTARETLALALKQAEDVTTQLLGYSPLPTWFLDEEHELVKPQSPELFFNSSRNVRGQSKSIVTDYGYVLEGGQRATSVIQLGAAVVYSDPDGDGYADRATVTVATAITDREEIAVFYPGKAGAEEWEIRPVSILLAGGTATITFPKHFVPLESQVERIPDPNVAQGVPIDGDTNSNFLATVDVYRIYNDPSQQLIFYTENGCFQCSGTGCAACGATSESGCLRVRDEKLGIVSYARADWDAAVQSFTSSIFQANREPEKVRIWYRAGLRNKKLTFPKRSMDPVWERLITFYALTLLDTEIGWCDNTKRIFAYQLEELDKNAAGKSYTVSDRLLNNPLGQTRAAVNLWQRISGPDGRLVTAR